MPSSRQAVWAPKAPKPNGNYSHVVKAKNGMVYLAGWMGDDPETGKIVSGGIAAQTERAILNIQACLEACGLTLDNILTRRVYIIPMQEYRDVMAVWDRYFESPYPVSTLIGVTSLAKEGALVEIEVVAER
ncbi:Endoribonuclease L-PSP/chorismate mutase-like protein [Exophiala viscosa]|uniref:Endoribonuclease L-PSP/chorismate mutase-like protein n=1 Tax=Exophiala viscosa TaxID=2486360 RepID=A0AAN6DZX8_9EURO|nr:Endoribonuclease L-PSP/chorismate mutase-like protein [Exophiala viscosa]KAI1621788.1 Endoribonuclease L-PSP/chorismate mutase-like protein [Exophiala viscosa]